MAVLKRNLEEESGSHEATLAEQRHKHSQELQQLNEQHEQIKKAKAGKQSTFPKSRRRFVGSPPPHTTPHHLEIWSMVMDGLTKLLFFFMLIAHISHTFSRVIVFLIETPFLTN